MRKAFLVLILGAAGASAATISFTKLPSNTDYGTYNGFAAATVDDGPAFLICDDYLHTTYFPSGLLNYNMSTLAGTNPLEYARFASPSNWEESLNQYEQAALLLDGLLNIPSGVMPDLTADYQYALWHLFTPLSVSLEHKNTAQLLFDETFKKVRETDSDNLNIYSRLLIYTPTGLSISNQEFLAMTAVPMTWSNSGPPNYAPIPEPAPWVLMSIGTGLLVLSSVPRRLRALARVRSEKS